MGPTPCPACGYLTTEVTGVGRGVGRTPKDGDVSVCLACGALGIFAAGGTALRDATPEEKAEIIVDVEVAHVVAAVLMLKGRDPEWPVGPRSPRR